MATSKQLNHLARNPTAHMRYLTTGRLPTMVEPKSPLIDLLLKLSPRDRAGIIGLTVDPALGYSGSRMFHTAEAALRWARPAAEMVESRSWPARSWQIMNFERPLTLDQLVAKASSTPPGLASQYPHLAAAPAPGKGRAAGDVHRTTLESGAVLESRPEDRAVEDQVKDKGHDLGVFNPVNFFDEDSSSDKGVPPAEPGPAA